MKMDILYQFNEKYAPYAGVSITSLFSNNQQAEEIVVWILGEDLTNGSKERLKRLAEQYRQRISFVDTTALIEQMKKLQMPTYRGSYAANMRLFLPEVLDACISKILYLDADTIVDSNIQDLFELNIGECPLAMALDSLGKAHKKDIGLEKQDYYYNSGVILFQMQEWRKQKLTEKIVAHVQQVRAHYPAPDQDLLNVVCKGRVFRLPPNYNFQPVHVAFSVKQYMQVYSAQGYYTGAELEKAKAQISIYHFFRFIGEFPWHQNSCHPDTALFDYYLKKSLWNDYQKESAKSSIFIRIEKCLYKWMPKLLFLYIFKISHRFFVRQANKQSLQMKIHKEM